MHNKYSTQQDRASGMTQELVSDYIPVSDAGVPRGPIATEILQKPQHTPDHFAIHCQAAVLEIQCKVTDMTREKRRAPLCRQKNTCEQTNKKQEEIAEDHHF